jgi:hypothetical protein
MQSHVHHEHIRRRWLEIELAKSHKPMERCSGFTMYEIDVYQKNCNCHLFANTFTSAIDFRMPPQVNSVKVFCPLPGSINSNSLLGKSTESS